VSNSHERVWISHAWVLKLHAGCQNQMYDLKITLVGVVKPPAKTQSGFFGDLTLILVGSFQSHTHCVKIQLALV
jgi:hypothetical protein